MREHGHVSIPLVEAILLVPGVQHGRFYGAAGRAAAREAGARAGRAAGP
jgi:hypothetical protein